MKVAGPLCSGPWVIWIKLDSTCKVQYKFNIGGEYDKYC
jgi:hypothetical protein